MAGEGRFAKYILYYKKPKPHLFSKMVHKVWWGLKNEQKIVYMVYGWPLNILYCSCALEVAEPFFFHL